MTTEEYTQWESTIRSIVDSGGTALLVGGVDTGKTTFVLLTANAVAGAGKTAAIIDSDLGQSEVGPPGSVGLGHVHSPVRSLAEVAPDEVAFVGSTTPRGRMLEHVVGIRNLADTAAVRNPHAVLVDTTGFIQGASGRRLKEAKAAILKPRHVVVLQRTDECEAMARALSGSPDRVIHRLPVPPVIARKPPAYRAQRRAAKFALYFRDSEVRSISFERAAFSHTWLNSGPPCAPHVHKFLANSAGARVMHAELHARFLGMVTDGPPTKGLSLIHEQFKPESIAISPVQRFAGLLVGLSDGSRLMGLGIVSRVDFVRRILEVQTPVRAVANVRLVDFGIIRVRPDGREIGTLRPGDV
jgi:polynucleotide 5'-hydroxyl-kinase GRC3/NOL9